MRLAHILVVVAATLLVASEAFSMTGESNQTPKVAYPRQRLLRAKHTAIEDNVESEERSLPEEVMKKMMKSKMTKEEFANKLGISAQIDDVLTNNGANVMSFMQTHEYQQYIGYVDYLNVMAKIKKYKKLVGKIKLKSLKQAE